MFLFQLFYIIKALNGKVSLFRPFFRPPYIELAVLFMKFPTCVYENLSFKYITIFSLHVFILSVSLKTE